MKQLVKHLSNGTIPMFRTYSVSIHSNVMYMPCEWSNKSLIVMQTDLEKRFSYLAVFKRLVTNRAMHHTYQ